MDLLALADFNLVAKHGGLGRAADPVVRELDLEIAVDCGRAERQRRRTRVLERVGYRFGEHVTATLAKMCRWMRFI